MNIYLIIFLIPIPDSLTGELGLMSATVAVGS